MSYKPHPPSVRGKESRVSESPSGNKDVTTQESYEMEAAGTRGVQGQL